MIKKTYPVPIKRIKDSKELFIAKILYKRLVPIKGEAWFELNHKEMYNLVKRNKS